MSSDSKLLLVLLALICGFLTWVGWVLPPHDPFVWALRLGAPAVAVAIVAVLVWSMTRKDKWPDLLRPLAGRAVHEASGFQFAVAPRERHGQLWLEFLYQNRYDRPLEATVVLQPEKPFIGRQDLRPLGVTIPCEGGEFGRVAVPYRLPEKRQGKAVTFSLSVTVRHPEGKGKAMRYRVGRAVRKGSIVAALLLGGVLGALAARGTRIKLRMPAGVAEEVDDWEIDGPETLWLPGDPVEGVLPRA